MNPRTDKERLLADVLTGEDANGFREALLSETLRLAHRRRRFRQVRRAASGVAMLTGFAFVVWRSLTPQVTPHERMPKNYEVVLSQPLPAAALVTTRPLAIDQLVAPLPKVQLVQTAQSAGQFREIDDDELLALAEQPAVLARLGPHWAELVVFNSTDEEATPPD